MHQFQEREVHLNSVVLTCGYSFHNKPFRLSYTHGIKHYLFRLQTEGKCKAFTEGRMQWIEPGDLLLYKPGDPYALEVEEGHHIASGDYFIISKGDWIREWWHRHPRKPKVNILLDERLLSVWRTLILEKRRFQEENQEMTSYLLKALCLCLDRAVRMKGVHKGKTFVTIRMKNYIDEHLTSPIRIDDVAAHVELSVSRAVHLFKEFFGVPIIEYTHQARLSLAEERIRYTQMSLEKVAETCGFGSYSYFFRVFRKKHGITPAQYRQQISADYHRS
jgi:AraC family transcriptional regulator of arabinose operon